MKIFTLFIIGLCLFYSCSDKKQIDESRLINVPIKKRFQKEIEGFVYYEEIYFAEGKLNLVSTELELNCEFHLKNDTTPIIFNSGVQIDFFFPKDIQIFKNKEGEFFIIFPLYPSDNEKGIIHKINVKHNSVHSFCKTIQIDKYFKFTDDLKNSRHRVLTRDKKSGALNYYVHSGNDSILLDKDCHE